MEDLGLPRQKQQNRFYQKHFAFGNTTGQSTHREFLEDDKAGDIFNTAYRFDDAKMAIVKSIELHSIIGHQCPNDFYDILLIYLIQDKIHQLPVIN